jgi:hypothetical protein
MEKIFDLANYFTIFFLGLQKFAFRLEICALAKAHFL